MTDALTTQAFNSCSQPERFDLIKIDLEQYILHQALQTALGNLRIDRVG